MLEHVAVAWRPVAAIICTLTSMAVMFLAQPTTTTPSCASLFAVSYPIPADAPVYYSDFFLPPLHSRMINSIDYIDYIIYGNSI